MPGGDGPDARVETLYRRMFHTLYAYALRGMSDPSLAEEAVQDTVRVACEREDKLFASDNPEGWLMNVLKNVIRSTRRERARLAETVLEVLDENGGAAVPQTGERRADKKERYAESCDRGRRGRSRRGALFFSGQVCRRKKREYPLRALQMHDGLSQRL